jgi:EpsI family protein
MKFSIQHMLLLMLMLISASLGVALRPTIYLADERAPIELADMVPKTFEDWREAPNQIAQIVNPQQLSLIKKIYGQTLNRTYINSQGYHVMLSIAYGKNQSDAMQLHKPEICYPAQGFLLDRKQIGEISLQGQSITATRLETSLGDRYEPITYWTLVGDLIVTSGIDKKIAELYYAMHNRIPDGMLIRISSIDKGAANAFSIQQTFSNDMINAIKDENRKHFSGNLKNLNSNHSE